MVWADNWASNAMAWASQQWPLAPMCDPGHWTTRLAHHLATDCPCCSLWRGLVLGGAAGFLVGVLAALM